MSVSTKKTWSVLHGKCEWCGATKDLERATLGEPRKTIRICRNQSECRTRHPEEWRPGTLGVPLKRIASTSAATEEERG